MRYLLIAFLLLTVPAQATMIRSGNFTSSVFSKQESVQADALLLETGDYLLLETGDRLLLE